MAELPSGTSPNGPGYRSRNAPVSAQPNMACTPRLAALYIAWPVRPLYTDSAPMFTIRPNPRWTMCGSTARMHRMVVRRLSSMVARCRIISVPRERGLLGQSELAEESGGVVVGADRRGATIVSDLEHISAIEVESLAGRRDTRRESLAGMRARHAPFAGDATTLEVDQRFADRLESDVGKALPAGGEEAPRAFVISQFRRKRRVDPAERCREYLFDHRQIPLVPRRKVSLGIAHDQLRGLHRHLRSFHLRAHASARAGRRPPFCATLALPRRSV